MKNLGLYFHIPFCLSKCGYCDFTSFANCKNGDIDEYVDYIIDEIKLHSEKFTDYLIDTAFIGGGTPSLLSEKNIYKLCDAIYKYFQTDLKEFTAECNPNSINEKKLKAFKDCGINRLSLGVQSFDDNILKVMGRAHTAKEAENAICTAKKYFDNINLDIIIGVPFQSIDICLSTLNKAVSFDINHLSVYQLIIEEGTSFYQKYLNKSLPFPSDDEVANLYEEACKFLTDKLEIYEVSNFAKKGFECMHNLKYWNFEEYLGVGLAAHSFFNGRRFYNPNDFESYYSALKTGNLPRRIGEILTKEDMMKEFVMTAFRTVKGISLERFESLFSEKFDKVFEKALIKCRKYINFDKNYINIKKEYFNLQNSVIVNFI